ncbi:MAG: tripartite tricarboxylate transporter substrate binding protein [Bradyrhizobiaceae bacterium]|nr:tripartite tricarboxylate transporter substrate binding protein [Bradyrhizobiaceae bacterium]MBO0754229.1 tripartite tricarboxylate transporter substrate binding protein [Bradyrhizobiaceae bacterium]
MNRIHKLVLAALAAAGLTQCAAAAAEYPDRPIRMVVGYAAGGPTDVIARIVATQMSEPLGQPVVVENKPAASAHIATQDVMNAAPDGYKVLASSLALTVNPLLYPDRYSYEADKAFEPITNIANLPMVLVVRRDSPYRSLSDLIADAKAHPGQLTFGSSGLGGSAHLAAEMLSSGVGIRMLHIPYKGNGPALQDLIGGRLAFMFYPSIGIANYVAGGALRVLAVGAKAPMADFPGVPTLDSLGLQGFEDGAPWVGLLAPLGTPRPIIDKLNRAAIAALNQPGVREELGKLGAYVIGDSPDEFRAFLIKDKTRWAAVIEQGNVKGE